jgi:hypothetical protein
MYITPMKIILHTYTVIYPLQIPAKFLQLKSGRVLVARDKICRIRVSLLADARWRAVLPFRSGKLTDAPASTSNWTMCGWRVITAKWRGVCGKQVHGWKLLCYVISWCINLYRSARNGLYCTHERPSLNCHVKVNENVIMQSSYFTCMQTYNIFIVSLQ